MIIFFITTNQTEYQNCIQGKKLCINYQVVPSSESLTPRPYDISLQQTCCCGFPGFLPPLPASILLLLLETLHQLWYLPNTVTSRYIRWLFRLNSHRLFVIVFSGARPTGPEALSGGCKKSGTRAWSRAAYWDFSLLRNSLRTQQSLQDVSAGNARWYN